MSRVRFPYRVVISEESLALNHRQADVIVDQERQIIMISRDVPPAERIQAAAEAAWSAALRSASPPWRSHHV